MVDNNFSSEQALFATENKKLIKEYNDIKVLITAGRIKWATTDITYNKHGQIVTLQEHRSKRIGSAIIWSIVLMIGVTIINSRAFL